MESIPKMNRNKLKITIDFEGEKIYKGVTDSFKKAKLILKDMEVKFK